MWHVLTCFNQQQKNEAYNFMNPKIGHAVNALIWTWFVTSRQESSVSSRNPPTSPSIPMAWAACATLLRCSAQRRSGVRCMESLGPVPWEKWAVDKNWMVGNLGIEACLIKFSWSCQQNYRVNMYSVKSNRMRQSWPVKVGFVHNRNVA